MGQPQVSKDGLKRRCRRRLRELEIPDPFDLDRFCASLSERTGRPIRLLALELSPSSPCGMWLSTATTDYVIYQSATDPLHQEHIVLHELSHIACAHSATSVLRTDTAERLLPHLDGDMVHSVLARSHYTQDQEREAELMASLILHRARRDSWAEATPARRVQLSAEDDARIAARIERSLQNPVRCRP
ncbi:hypothetical protein H0B56_11150 [Haloechinothrix sp. YIM 98757]|uniref:IrrE N-terminal-like domain-containing protein n=1 Tax=Haloechinothrix aidingensis TaxID=2752311 RepID=A0A838A9X6_9PSEU|nr:hypothetical protein [Haloechinothrix aidingensis]MBA0126097.1 hypothetical protein [Haloechinothrix aidingensis]